MACSVSRAGWFSLAALAFFAFCSHAGELFRPVPPDAQVTRFARFNIRYTLRDIVADGVTGVDFYVTEDMGRTWRHYGEDPDRISPMTVQVEGEGIYGFVCVATDRFGNREREPGPRTRPETVIVVDRTPPTAKWISPLQDVLGKGDPVEFQWEAGDTHLRDAPVRIQYAENARSNHDRDANWKDLQPNLPAAGSISWVPPHEASSRFNFRLIAEDRAGNLGIAYNPATLVVDTMPPTISGVQPLRSNQLRVNVSVAAGDDPSGSGIKEVSLYSSENGGMDWILLKERSDTGESVPVRRSPDLPIPFEAEHSGEFALWPVAFDAAENGSPLPVAGVPGPYILVIDDEAPNVTLSSSFLQGRSAILVNETRVVEWTSYDPHPKEGAGVISLSLDNGRTWQEIRSGLSSSGSAVINFPFGSASDEAMLRIVIEDDFGNTGEGLSQSFKLSAADTVITGVAPPGGEYQPPSGAGYAPQPAPPASGQSAPDPYFPVSGVPNAAQSPIPYSPPTASDPYSYSPYATQPPAFADPYQPPYSTPAYSPPAGESTAGSFPSAMLGSETSQTPSAPPAPPPPPQSATPTWNPTPAPPAATVPSAFDGTVPFDSPPAVPPPPRFEAPGSSLTAPQPPADQGMPSGSAPPAIPAPVPPVPVNAPVTGDPTGSVAAPPPPGGSEPPPASSMDDFFSSFGTDLQPPPLPGEQPLSAPPFEAPSAPSPSALSAPPPLPSTPALTPPTPPQAPSLPTPAAMPLPGATDLTAPPSALPPIPGMADDFSGSLAAPPVPAGSALPADPRRLSNHYAEEAKNYLDEGRVDLALESATNAVNADGTNALAYSCLAQVYVQQDPPNFARAASLAKEATDLGMDWHSWWTCADVFYRWSHARNRMVQSQLRGGQQPSIDLLDERNQALNNAQIAIGNAGKLVRPENEADMEQVALTQGEIAYLRALSIPEPVRPPSDAPATTQTEYRNSFIVYKNSVTPILQEALPHFQTALRLGDAPSYREAFHLGIINFRLGGLEKEVGNAQQSAGYYETAARYLEQATTAAKVPAEGPREAYYMLAYSHDQLADQPGRDSVRQKEFALRYWRRTAEFYAPGSAYRDFAERRMATLQQELGQ